MMEDIEFRTSDGVTIHGCYRSVPAHSPVVIVLHMMPATKESWRVFQEKLWSVGFGSLAIDLRGHGSSVHKGEEVLDYRTFSDMEHQEKTRDVAAAVDFFISRGIPLSRIAFAGASIGANLALQFQAEHKEVSASVLLSPGLDYRGIKTEPLVQGLAHTQAVFLSAARGDISRSGSSCADMAEALFTILPSRNKKLSVVDGKEHGTDMFAANPKLMDDIIRWLQRIYF